MTFTYSGNLSTEVEEVRFLIGDTNSADAQLSDEEIQYLLTDEGSVGAAAVAACRSLMAKYSRLVDKAVDGLRLNYSQRVTAYKELMAKLEARQASRSGGVIVGGTSVSRKELVESNTDRVPNSFVRGQFDYDGEEQGYESPEG